MNYKKINNQIKVNLKNDEQITFFQKKNNFDIAKKNWGFYLSPSIQNRCLKNGYKGYLIIHNNDCKIFFLNKKMTLKNVKKILQKEKNEILEIYKSSQFSKFF